MKINFFNEDIKFNLKEKKALRDWIRYISLSYGKRIGEINYIFTSDQYILEINKKYLQHNYFTDIITFNYNEGNIVSGDIFISVETVSKNSIVFHTNPEDEMRRVIIHGLLHLIGFDDADDQLQKLMRQEEDKSLLIFDSKSFLK